MQTLSYDKEPALSPTLSGEVWVLVEDWHIRINGEPFCIQRGYFTDGASIPRFLWRVCGHPMSTVRLPIAIVHDAIYDGTLRGYTRKQADAIFRDALVERGHPKWKASLEYTVLRWFGAKHWGI